MFRIFGDLQADIKTWYKGQLVRVLLKTFTLWQRLGFHIMLRHYASPIPDTRTLGKELWLKRRQLTGIEMNEERQLALLSELTSKFKHEYETFPRTRTSSPHQYYVDNGLFETVDGAILYCMIRRFKPKRIVEIGCGNSTYLSARAILKNREEGGHECELIGIEPYPNDVLRTGFPGLAKLVVAKAEDVPLSTFDQLKEDDILFIDSSHVLKIGGDVQHEILEILPRVNRGVLVHIHDIFMPEEILPDWVFKYRWFYTEQYIFHAFLLFNQHFEVLWAGRYMYVRHPSKLEEAFNFYDPTGRGTSSFWIRRVK